MLGLKYHKICKVNGLNVKIVTLSSIYILGNLIQTKPVNNVCNFISLSLSLIQYQTPKMSYTFKINNE